MAKPSINPDLCTGCGICVEECDHDALRMTDDVVQLVRPADCGGCGACAECCPSGAAVMK